jgi:hypothetical protein
MRGSKTGFLSKGKTLNVLRVNYEENICLNEKSGVETLKNEMCV